MLSAFRAGVSVVVGFQFTNLAGHMLSLVSVAWRDILSSIRQSHWLTGAAAVAEGNGAMCKKLKMIALLEKLLELDRRNHGKTVTILTSLQSFSPALKVIADLHSLQVWLLLSLLKFAFSWRTEKQRPRVVHAVTTTCLHCKYSFELQRRQAEDPRVVHAMTLAPAVENFFQLKNRQRESP